MKRYEYAPYWMQRGKGPAEPYPVQKKIKLLETLCDLKFDSVLEIGAGDGELTRIIMQYFKPKRYLAIDLVKERLDKIDVDVEKKEADILHFETDEKFDLVIAAHTLLHIEQDNIRKIMQKMYHFSKKYVAHVDPIPFAISGSWAYYNFPHEYWELWYEMVNKVTFRQVEEKVGLWLVEK